MVRFEEIERSLLLVEMNYYFFKDDNLTIINKMEFDYYENYRIVF